MIAVTASSNLPHSRGAASTQQQSAGGRVWTWVAFGPENLGVEVEDEDTQQLVLVIMDTQLFDWVQVVMVAAGNRHAVLLMTEGRVFTWTTCHGRKL